MAKKEIEEFRRSMKRNEETLELQIDTFATTNDLQRLKKDIKCNEEKIKLQKQMIASLSGRIRKIKEKNVREEKLLNIIETIEEEGDASDDSQRKIKEIILINDQGNDGSLSKLPPQTTILKKVSMKKGSKGNRVTINEASEDMSSKQKKNEISSNDKHLQKVSTIAEREKLRSLYGDINCDVFVNINDSCKQISNEVYDHCELKYDQNRQVRDCGKIKVENIAEIDGCSDNVDKAIKVKEDVDKSGQCDEGQIDYDENKVEKDKSAIVECSDHEHTNQSMNKNENIDNYSYVFT